MKFNSNKIFPKRYRNLVLILAPLLVTFQNCGDSGFVVKDQQTISLGSTLDFTQGKTLYSTHCASCHGELSVSQKKGVTMGLISDGINSIPQMAHLKSLLSLDQIEAIAVALNNGSVPAPPVKPAFVSWNSLTEKSCSPQTTETRGGLIDPVVYKNVIEDLFAVTVDNTRLPKAVTKFYKSGENSGAYSMADLSHLERLFEISEKVASDVILDIGNKSRRLVACNIADANASVALNCQNEVLMKTLSRVYRKRITAVTDPLFVKTMSGADALSFPDRWSLAIRVSLMMPEFLYPFEYNEAVRATDLTMPKTRSLSHYEAATRLAMTIWNSYPDEALLDAAAANQLLVPATYQAQVNRLLADAKADRFVQKFADEWLDLNDLANRSTLPGASAALMTAFQGETRAFMRDLFVGNTDFRQFYSSQQSFMNQTLAAHYGVPGITGTNFVKASRPQADLQAGFLTQGSFSALTAGGSVTEPIFRGVYVAKRLLCLNFGSPPPGATLVDIPGNTKYEIIQNRAKVSSCSRCHSTFDTIGYTLEPLSTMAVGRSLDEQQQPVGAQMVNLFTNQPAKNPRDLGLAIAENSQSGTCLSEMLYKYATRSPATFDTENLGCQINNVTVKSFTSGNSIKEYLRQLTMNPLFLNKLETK